MGLGSLRTKKQPNGGESVGPELKRTVKSSPMQGNEKAEKKKGGGSSFVKGERKGMGGTSRDLGANLIQLSKENLLRGV